VLISTGTAPLLANLMAFVSAFAASFFGHFYYSFAELSPKFAGALVRFCVTASAGFLLNESLLAPLLRYPEADPPLVFTISAGMAAIATFILGRFWAFAPDSQRW
jgi:putative flippase GtrA